jgi:hypothetical protein
MQESATLKKDKNMTRLNEVKRHLRPGGVYRRSDLARWSNAVDRHLRSLLKEGTLTKLSGGLYYCPKKTVFGEAPAEDEKLVQGFLKDSRFLLSSPNAFNVLGVGTTQLYNETVVYNHKRNGRFDFGGRVFEFRVKPAFPRSLSEEFLLVDLVNNLGRLAEDNGVLLDRVKQKATAVNTPALKHAVRNYGGVRAKNFFAKALQDVTLLNAA